MITPPATTEAAEQLQKELAPRVIRTAPPGFDPPTATGLDVAYAKHNNQVAAAAVTIDMATGTILARATAVGEATFPYTPGLFAFRELPTLLEALAQLPSPDLLIADGHGTAHPRRFGLACHLGIETNLPTIGVAKTPMGDYTEPGPERGDTSQLTDDTEQVGVALRTRQGAKPVFVSIGHRIDLATAISLVLRLSHYRLPETTRQADQLSRRTLRAASS